MSAKGKDKDKGKNKKGKDQKNKLTQVDKTFYELTIADLNKKLARLRSQVMAMDEQNAGVTEQLRSLKEDRADVAAYLERTLVQRNETIASLESQLNNIINLRNTEKEQCTAHIKDNDTKYKAMHDQLTSEIKLLNGKLNSLDEFRVKRDELMTKYDNLVDEMNEKDRQHQEQIYAMEQKAIVEKDAIRKEVELKLLQVSEDFTRSSEIRNAGYTRRLIRENIALQKENDRLIMSQLKIQRDMTIQTEKHKEILEQNDSLNQLKNQLIMASQNKALIIKRLTEIYERLKTKYTEMVRYRSLYETVMKRDSCERFNVKKATQKVKRVTRKSNLLMIDKSRLYSVAQRLDSENRRLRTILQQIKEAVIDAVIAKGVKEKEKVTKVCKVDVKKGADLKIVERERDRKLSTSIEQKTTDQMKYDFGPEERRDLLSKLLQIINERTHREEGAVSQVSAEELNVAVYKPGKIGLFYKKKSIMDIFKTDMPPQDDGTAELYRSKMRKGPGVYIPAERSAAFEKIMDVEHGSTYYASSSHNEAEEDIEECVEEVEEEESSDDYEVDENIPTDENVSHKPDAGTELEKIEQSSPRNYTSALDDDEEYNANLFY